MFRSCPEKRGVEKTLLYINNRVKGAISADNQVPGIAMSELVPCLAIPESFGRVRQG